MYFPYASPHVATPPALSIHERPGFIEPDHEDPFPSGPARLYPIVRKLVMGKRVIILGLDGGKVQHGSVDIGIARIIHVVNPSGMVVRINILELLHIGNRLAQGVTLVVFFTEIEKQSR